MGHTGAADWTWAREAREVVSIPVIVNGDVRTADDAERALEETGCAGVMVGRGAIEHPVDLPRGARACDRGEVLPPPTVTERLTLLSTHYRQNVEWRGERNGVDHRSDLI